MSTNVETRLSSKQLNPEHDREIVADFLKTQGFERIILNGCGQNLTDPTCYAFEWGSAEKGGKRLGLMITRDALREYGPGGLPEGLLLHQQRSVSEGVNEFLKGYQQMEVRLLPTLAVYDIVWTISVAVQEGHNPNSRFLGNQTTLKLDPKLPHYFPKLAMVFHALSNLTPKNAPSSLLGLARNYSELPESLEKTKQNTIQTSQERLKKLIADKSIPEELEQPLASMISNYVPLIGFSLYDRAPWTTMVEPNGELTFTNYWWAGFRDKYYDPIYFFIKLWGHAGRDDLARQWLRTYWENTRQQERDAFQTQFWNLAAIRLVQDLEESKSYRTREQLECYQRLLELVIGKRWQILTSNETVC